MILTPNLRPSVNAFEDQVVRTLSNLRYRGFVANNLLLPNVSLRCYPDEHDVLLLLPWAGYTIEAKNWRGEFRFPGNNPAQWSVQPPSENQGGSWRILAGYPNPFHVGKQKASVLHTFLAKAGIPELAKYPVYPLIILPNGSTFTPDRGHFSLDDHGPMLNIRILHLNQLQEQLQQDQQTARRDGRREASSAALEKLLQLLEAEPTTLSPGNGICGFSLTRRVDAPELGCPVDCAVYEATHDFSQTKALVRLYQRWPQNNDTDRFLKHASRRAAILLRSRARNVIRLRHAEEMPDQLVLAFEHYPGESLSNIIGQRPLPAPLVRSLLAHLAHTVQELHDESVIHHDLRPEYVLVGPELEKHGGADHRLVGLTNPLVDDASLSTEVFQNNFAASFTSIEMRTHRHPARGKPPSDIFSLGRLGVYCLLGETRYRDAVNQSTDEPLPFDLSAFDAGLRRVLQRAMEFRSEHRYASARDFAADLNSVGPPPAAT